MQCTQTSCYCRRSEAQNYPGYQQQPSSCSTLIPLFDLSANVLHATECGIERLDATVLETWALHWKNTTGLDPVLCQWGGRQLLQRRAFCAAFILSTLRFNFDWKDRAAISSFSIPWWVSFPNSQCWMVIPVLGYGVIGSEQQGSLWNYIILSSSSVCWVARQTGRCYLIHDNQFSVLMALNMTKFRWCIGLPTSLYMWKRRCIRCSYSSQRGGR